MMANNETPGKWIGELFQPVYSFTVDDVLSPQDEGPIKSKIKRVAAFDPDAIQQVYEKVRVMNILDAEMKLQTRDHEIAELAGQTRQTKTYKQAHGETQGDSLAKTGDLESPKDLMDSCIWDTDELDVLRKVYKSAKGRIKELQVEVREANRRSSVLEKENSHLKKELEANSNDLREACKSNKRLKIHCDNLKEQLEFASAKVDAVTEMWKEISLEKTAMQKETQDLRIQTDRERLARERLEIKAEECAREIMREKQLAEDNAQTKYEKMIFDLQQEIKLLTDELMKERQSHDISKKALGSLRNHFASLPLKNIIPPNAVHEDQVTNIDYLSL